MIQAVWCILYLWLILLLGYALVSAILQGGKRSLLEILGLSATVGAGALAMLLFWVSLAGTTPSRTVLLCIGILALLVAVIFQKRSTSCRPSPIVQETDGGGRRSHWLLLLLLPLLAVFLIVFSHSLLMPLYEWDAIGIWGLKAKVLCHEDLRTATYFYREELTYSKMDYPLLVPFLTSGAYASMGAINDQMGKVIFPFLYLAFACLIYSALRWRLKKRLALLLTVFFLTLPELVKRSGAGTADGSLTLFYAGSVHFLVKWLVERRRADLVFCMLFTVFCAFTKSEGLALAVINVAVFAAAGLGRLRSEKGLPLLLYTAGVAALILPWLLWSKDVLRSSEDYASRIRLDLVLENISRLKPIFLELLKQIVVVSKWGILWIFLLASAAFGWRAFRKKHVLVMWSLFVLHICLYVFVLLVGPWDPERLFVIALDRLILHATPAALFLIAFHLQEEAG